MKLRIAQLVRPILPIPPAYYGGIEKIVSMLTEELVRRGHKVTLFATGDSKTKARLKYLYKKSLGVDKTRPLHNLTQMFWALNNIDDYDILHNHAEFYCFPMLKYFKTPAVTTMHNDYLRPNTLEFDQFKNVSHFVFISKNQEERLRGLKSAGVVYNSTDINKYKFCEKKEDYMFFVGNSTKTKGPDLAIKVARRVKGKLIMATKVDDKYRNFFNSAIKPYADGKNMILHEKISFEKKLDLYQHAKCLLFPIRWEEPFGLVMIEAMACGTPVVAMNRGSVPEVIKHGETGFVADNYGEFVEYVKRVDEIDPRKCRKWVEKNFTIGKMTDGYLKVYKKLLKG